MGARKGRAEGLDAPGNRVHPLCAAAEECHGANSASSSHEEAEVTSPPTVRSCTRRFMMCLPWKGGWSDNLARKIWEQALFKLRLLCAFNLLEG